MPKASCCSALRAVIGPTMPLVASLDLHANVTQRMLQHASAMSAYRTYPHVECADTGARVARFLQQRLAARPRPHLSARRVPFLIPLQTQCTMLEPTKSIYEELARLEDRSKATLSFTPGFPAADFPECGPVVIAYADDPAAATRAADLLRGVVEEQESAFDCPVYDAGRSRAARHRSRRQREPSSGHCGHSGQPRVPAVHPIRPVCCAPWWAPMPSARRSV